MARWFSIRPGITMKGRKFKGLRGFAGKPFHPPLTDIPVAAYTILAVFDVISFALGDDSELAGNLFTAGTYVLVFGLVVTVPTGLTGFWDWLKSTPKRTQARRTANWHMTVMLTAASIALVDLIIRQGVASGDPAPLGVAITSVVVGGLIAFGATYGGSLVYDYGFNVETSGDHPVWHESEEDVFPGQS
jgi:uncharacterized membrane protein